MLSEGQYAAWKLLNETGYKSIVINIITIKHCFKSFYCTSCQNSLTSEAFGIENGANLGLKRWILQAHKKTTKCRITIKSESILRVSY